jgi:hypothetical protein
VGGIIVGLTQLESHHRRDGLLEEGGARTGDVESTDDSTSRRETGSRTRGGFLSVWPVATVGEEEETRPAGGRATKARGSTGGGRPLMRRPRGLPCFEGG